MNDQAWQSVAEPADEAAARILVGLLESESVPVRLRSNTPVPGLGIAFRVEVPASQVERARDVLRNNQVTEEELVALALTTKPADPV